MDVSFVIPAHNEEGNIEACVRGAFSCSPREVVVANNGSTDGTADILSRLKVEYGDALRVVDVRGKGVARARQAGLDVASGEYVASVDADCRPNPEWFARLSGLFLSHPDAVCVSGSYVFYDLPTRYKPLNDVKEWILKTLNRFTPIGRSQLCGGNFLIRRETLLRAGGFDVEKKFFGEDVETERRVRRLGRIVFSRDAAIPSSARRLLGEGMIVGFFFPRINRYYQLVTGRPLLSSEEKDWRSIPGPE